MKTAVTKFLEVLGHAEVLNNRCPATYKDPENPAPGCRSFPVWCDLSAGHDGPHKHVTGHRWMIMDREHLIEMKPLPSICKHCGTVWPCNASQKIMIELENYTKALEEES